MDSISLSTIDTNNDNTNDHNNSSEESVRTKYKKLEAKYKTVCEQKVPLGYKMQPTYCTHVLFRFF